MNGIKQRNFEKIFFGPNGAAGMVFYAGVLIAALAAVAFGVNLLTPAYVLPVLVLPLALMLFREPLSHLAAGDPEMAELLSGGGAGHRGVRAL